MNEEQRAAAGRLLLGASLRQPAALLRELAAEPVQPMRCPEDGGECGAGGYCRPEPQQRKPLSDAQILDALGIDGSDDWTFTVARAIEKAHGIKGEQK